MKIFLSFPCLILILSTWFKHTVGWNIFGFNVEVPKITTYNPYCLVNECCNDHWIKFSRAKLAKNLQENVYGQPLLENALRALSMHFNPNFPPSKALALSFHGMTGTGKNYVSNFIADSIYSKGSQSKYVHHFIGRMHFSEKSQAEKYKSELYSMLKNSVTTCPRQLFIFDEVDKMIPEVLNAIMPMLDYRNNVDGVDYSQSVFIFLSNTGADIVTEHFHDLYLEGRKRGELKMSDFETYIQKGAFNEQKGGFNFEKIFQFVNGLFLKFLGGFHRGDVIKYNLIDHYIPFLPLEEEHVRMCIIKEFLVRNIRHPEEEHINEVIKFVEWGPDSTRLFSKTGCKRLGSKVALLVDQHYRHLTQENEEL